MNTACATLLVLGSLLVPREDPADEPQVSPYTQRLREAARALEGGELDAARAALDAVSIETRGFEWRHLDLAVTLARTDHAAPGLKGPGAGRRLGGGDGEASKAVDVGPVSVLDGRVAANGIVAISPGGDRLATVGVEDDVWIWNAHTGDVERLLVGHTGLVADVAFSPEGERLVTASADGTARVWRLSDGECRLVMRAGIEAMTRVAWAPDGKHVVTADTSFAVRVWSGAQSEALLALRGHTAPILSLAFSADGLLVGSSSEDGSVRIADVARGEIVRVLTAGQGAASACCFDPGRGRIAIGRQDWAVRIFDPRSDELLSVLRQKDGPITALAFTPDGKRLIGGTEKGAIVAWDPAETNPVYVLHERGPAIRRLAFDARGTRLVVGAEDGSVRVLETEVERARGLQRRRIGELPTLEEAAEMKAVDVDALCRRVVHHPGLDEALYSRAEELSWAAWDRLKEGGQIKTTMGGAQYRLGRYEDALATLSEANDIKRGWAPNLAFRAMALAKLGKLDEAATQLQRLETLMKEARWRTDVEARALTEEARAVLTTARSSR